MDEEKPSELKADLKFDVINSADTLANTLAIKIIISELAIKDREPREAIRYLENFRGQMTKFVDGIEDSDNPVNKLVKETISDHIEKLFSGIQFEKDHK